MKKWEVVRAQTSPLSFYFPLLVSDLKSNIVFLEEECPWTVLWGHGRPRQGGTTLCSASKVWKGKCGTKAKVVLALTGNVQTEITLR